MVEFRLVVFRPFVGEILTGTILASDEKGLQLSMGFFDEVHVPNTRLQKPCSWSADEKLWVWNVTESDVLFFDLQNDVRFRVVRVEFTHIMEPPRKDGTDDVLPAMRIIASVDEEGLGLLQWWPGADEEEGEEEGGEEGEEG